MGATCAYTLGILDAYSTQHRAFLASGFVCEKCHSALHTGRWMPNIVCLDKAGKPIPTLQTRSRGHCFECQVCQHRWPLSRPRSPLSVLWFGLAASFVIGLLSASVLPSYGIIAPAVFVAFVATDWCRLDAEQREVNWTAAQANFTFFLYPIAVPVYLIKTRRANSLPAILFALIYGVVVWLLTYWGFIVAG